MNKSIFTLITVLAIVFPLASLQSNAIIIRHDVDDSKYIRSADEFPELVQLAKSGPFGTLIHPQWFVTAAHASYCLTSGTKVKIGHKLYEVAELYHHPLTADEDDYDIALVKLKNAVDGVGPMQLYRESDELHKVIWFAGAGQTGTGISGNIERADDGKVLRVGSNKIISVDNAAFRVKFDKPGAATKLEGLPGFGDSGGPAFIESNGQRLLVGIISRSEGSELLVGLYSIIDVSVRISYFYDWIFALIHAEDKKKSEIAAFIPAISTESPFHKVCQKDAY